MRQTPSAIAVVVFLGSVVLTTPMAALAQSGGTDASVDDPAPPPPAPAAEPTPGTERDSLSHENQLGIRVGAGMPYVFAIKYGTGPNCDAEGGTFCKRFGAPLLDVELGFGIGEGAEVSMLARFGLSDDDAARHSPLIFGLGIRGYGSPHDMVKLFFGGRLILDATSGPDANWSSVDIGARGEFGLQVDFIRYVGAYIQLGETISFLRGLYFTTDLTGGVQARFP